jgi:hypothetical protein
VDESIVADRTPPQPSSQVRLRPQIPSSHSTPSPPSPLPPPLDEWAPSPTPPPHPPSRHGSIENRPHIPHSVTDWTPSPHTHPHTPDKKALEKAAPGVIRPMHNPLNCESTDFGRIGRKICSFRPLKETNIDDVECNDYKLI